MDSALTHSQGLSGAAPSRASAPVTARPSVGVVGVGALGGGIAESLLRAGLRPTLYDVREEVLSRFTDARRAASAKEVAAACDAVIVAVVSEQQVGAVFGGPDGLLAGARPGLLVIVVSTISVDRLQELAEVAAGQSVRVLDCGVTGGAEGAEAGELVSMVGGTEGDVADARPILDAFSSLVVHMGGLGRGMQTKILRNLITYSSFVVAHEAAALARAAGLDIAGLATVVSTADTRSGGSAAKQLTREADPRRRNPKGGPIARKDLDAAIEFADSMRVDAPVASFIRSVIDSVYPDSEIEQ